MVKFFWIGSMKSGSKNDRSASFVPVYEVVTITPVPVARSHAGGTAYSAPYSEIGIHA